MLNSLYCYVDSEMHNNNYVCLIVASPEFEVAIHDQLPHLKLRLQLTSTNLQTMSSFSDGLRHYLFCGGMCIICSRHWNTLFPGAFQW